MSFKKKLMHFTTLYQQEIVPMVTRITSDFRQLLPTWWKTTIIGKYKVCPKVKFLLYLFSEMFLSILYHCAQIFLFPESSYSGTVSQHI